MTRLQRHAAALISLLATLALFAFGVTSVFLAFTVNPFWWIGFGVGMIAALAAFIAALVFAADPKDYNER